MKYIRRPWNSKSANGDRLYFVTSALLLLAFWYLLHYMNGRP